MKNKALFTVLVGSIAQLVHGATIDSNSPVNGNWSDTNSWLSGTVPDTYGFDSVIIHLGDVIDYDSGASTPGGLVGPGGLAVAGGQFITIDGGSLTQNTIANEIRIGEGSSGTGDGILNIDNGGSFNSGAALAVAIGASLGGGPGSGVVNLNNGTFTMGAGAATGGLVVGVDGSTGVFNVGDGLNAATLDLATNNIGLGIGYLFAGPTGGTGTVVVNANGVVTTGTTGVAVGTGGGMGTLTINGGTFTGGTGRITVGEDTGTTATLAISNNGTLTAAGELRVGSNGGTGTLTMDSGTLGASEFNVGRGTGASGTATITGGTINVGDTFFGRDGGMATIVYSNATLTSTGAIHIGNNGSGDVGLSSGALSSAGQFVVGVNASGAGTLTVTGGSITAGSQFDIGQNSGNVNNAVTISAGSITSGAEMRIGEGVGGFGTLNISGTANLVANGEFQDGNDGGNGVVNMTGGNLTANSWFGIGRTGGTGVFNLSGGTITKGTGGATGTFDISTYHNGAPTTTTGTLNQTGGAIVNTVSDTNIARDAGNVGFWNMFGGTATLANFHIGNDGTGTMNITGTDLITINTSGQIEIGANGIGNGTLNMDNPNATINIGTEMQLGRNGAHGEVHQSAGVVNANGGWFGIANDGSAPSGLYDISGGQLHVGPNMEIGAEGVGELRLSGNAIVTASSIHAAQRVNGTGILTISDTATLTVGGQIVIGYASANANVANVMGGTISSGSETVVGQGVGNFGTLNLTGPGTWTSGGEFQVGNDGGNGVANITAGTILAKSYVAIGRNTNGNGGLNGGNGIVNLTGGTIQKIAGNGGSFDIGSWNGGNAATTNTSGTLNQTGGAIINTVADTNIGRDTGVVGVWNMQGGTANLASLRIGLAGIGTMNISGTDPVTVNASNIRIGGEGGTTGNGTLIISNPNAVITSAAEMGTGRNGGHGEVHQSAGILNAGGGWFGIANDPQNGSQPVSGLYDISGGQLNALSATVELGADGAGQLLISGTGQVKVANVHVGQRAFGTGTLTVGDTASLTASGQIVVGFGSANANVATISGGTVTSGSQTQVGEGAGHTGTLNISGGALTVGDEFQIGNDSGSGVVNMSGGSVQINQWGAIGRNGGTGVLNLSAGTITMAVNNRTFDIGAFGAGAVIGKGTFNQTGGALINTGADTNIARDNTSLGIWNMQGGTATLARLNVGNSGNGTLNMSGGNISASNRVSIAPNGGSTGTANLNGGVLTTQFVEAGGGVAALNMNGGTLRAFGNEGNFLRNITLANSEVLAGGITFDSNTFTITANNAFDGVGGLTKIGNGTLILTNTGNVYGGSTTVTGGTLQLAASEVIPNTSAVVVNGAGATFNVNDNTETVASIASVAGSTIALGSGTLTAGANDSSTVLDGATTGTAGSTLNKVGLGTLTINGPQSYSVLNSNSGITTLNSSLPNATLNNNAGILNVNANATNSTVNVHAITNFGSSQTLTALNIDNASVATLTAHSGGPANVKAIDTSALTFAGTGKLDLTNNAMVVRGGNYATLYGQVVSGLNMGAWDGVGINSSTAATDPTGRTALAIVDNSVAGFTDFAGVTGLTGNEVILKYTYYGDADLSGTVTQDDYFLFLEGFVNGAPASWLFGDFDYSGSVTQDDYFLFLETYLNQGGALRDPALAEQLNTFALQLNGGGDGTTSTTSAIAEVGSTLDGGSLGSDSGAGSGASAAGRAVVPEPSSIALLAVGALGLITRRRRAAK